MSVGVEWSAGRSNTMPYPHFKYSLMDSIRRRLRGLSSDEMVRKLAVGSATTLVIKVASAGLTYAMFVLLARAMALADFGRFSFGFNLATFGAVLASFGAHVGITRWLPEYIATGRPEVARQAFRWGIGVTAVGSVIWIAVMLLGGVVSSNVIGPQFNYLLVASGLIAPIAFAEYFANAFRAKGSVVAAQLPKDIAWRLAVCTMALICISQSTVIGVNFAFTFVAGSLGLLVVLQVLFVERCDLWRTFRDHADGDHRQWRGVLLFLWGGAILNAMIQYIDVVLVGLYLSPELSGAYFAVVRTANLIGLMLIASTMVCVPIISRYVHAGQTAELQRILKVVAILIAVPTIGAFLFVVMFGEWMLGLFDPSFRSGYPALVILAAGYTFNALCGPVGYTLMLTGQERVYLKIMAISYAGVVAIQCIAIPMFGMIGAAIGSTLGMVLWNIWSRRTALRTVGIDSTIFCVFRH